MIEPQSDLTIEATHKLINSGQHRPYTLSLHFTPRPRGEKETNIPWNQCKLKVEWPLPGSVLIDVWSLKRLTPFTMGQSLSQSNVKAGLPTWTVKPRQPDLEVGAYESKAKPFILTAEIPFRIDGREDSRLENGRLIHLNADWNLNLNIPDLVIRYQSAQIGSVFKIHPNKVAYLPAPNVKFNCFHSNEEEMHVDWQINRLRPLQISLPIGSATPLVSHVTFASVILSSLFLMFTLWKF